MVMKTKGVCGIDRHRRNTNLKHSFAIGPLCDSYLFAKKARLYYCTRCTWNFLVGDGAVAVLGRDGKPLAGEEAKQQFQTFENGPCPVLQTLAAETGVVPINGMAAEARQSKTEEEHPASQWSYSFRPWLRRVGSHRKDFRWQA